MKRSNSNSGRVSVFLIISLMLLVFCVMKVIRGSNTDSAQIGGIWNYISLLYYPIVLFIILTKRRFRVSRLFMLPTAYIFFAFVAVSLNFDGGLTANNIYSVLMIPYFFLVFCTFYYFSDHESRSCARILLLTFYVCLLINFYSIMRYQFFGGARPLASDIYFSLGLFPFTLMLVDNSLLKMTTFCGMFFAVFFSGKRAGLIAFVLVIFCYCLLKANCENKRDFARKLKPIIAAGSIVILFYLVSVRFDSMFDLGIYKRLFRLYDDGGSGRVDIYMTVWKEFCESPFINKLFGHGIYASENITFSRAHNDFLEILYDYGVAALVCFVGFYLSLFSVLLKMLKRNSPYAPAFACSLVIGVFLSMFSFYMTYYTYVTGGAAFMGYCIAAERERIYGLRF